MGDDSNEGLRDGARRPARELPDDEPRARRTYESSSGPLHDNSDATEVLAPGGAAPGGARAAGPARAADEPEPETPTRRRRRAPKKQRSKLRITLYTLLSMFLVVLLALGGFALYLNHVLDSNVRRAQMLPPAESQLGRSKAAGDARNILLLGSDSRTKDLGDASRADVIQLVHIPDDRSAVQIIHFPRDLYVDIPGRGKNKINAAFAFGGPSLLVQTMERLIGVRIDHVAQVGFDGFKDLTDTLGGVDVNVKQASVSGGYKFNTGINHMNGEQALAFVRERKQLNRGDIDRGVRQQAWLRAMMGDVLAGDTLLNPVKLTGMVNDMSKNMVVDQDFSTSDMRNLAISLRDVRGSKITFLTAPYTGFKNIKGVGDVDIVDEEGMKRLGTALQTDEMADLPGQSTTPG